MPRPVFIYAGQSYFSYRPDTQERDRVFYDLSLSLGTFSAAAEELGTSRERVRQRVARYCYWTGNPNPIKRNGGKR